MKSLNYLLVCSLLLFSSPGLMAQGLTSTEIDRLVEKTIKTFDVPGIAVAVIKDGKVVLSKGYGVRSLHSQQPVDEHTRFGIASNTKAFTATALGILVDAGKLRWDDKVTDYIPEFKLYDSYVTQDFTVRDLLTHRSGLGLGAGDLMLWPDKNDFTRADVIHNLRYLKQASPFRSKYDYDNNLYIVAGEVIARVSGLSYEDFIQKRILDPLGMTESAPAFRLLADTLDIIDAHAPVNGKVQVIERDQSGVLNAAGGIYSSVHDLSKWVIMQLNQGAYGSESGRLISKQVQHDLVTPQTLMPINTVPPYHSHFAAYGLGFRLSDVKGYLEVSHTGGINGMVTQITMYPELQLGIIVLTNQQVASAFAAITNQIKDSYLGISGNDWVALLSERLKAGNSQADQVVKQVSDEIARQQASGYRPDAGLFTGTYRDPWLGDVYIEQKDNRLWFRSKRSPGLAGELFYYKGQTFVVRWNNRSFDADAFVLFQSGFDGKAIGIRMKALSPLTDFSYDFQDLDFKKVQ